MKYLFVVISTIIIAFPLSWIKDNHMARAYFEADLILDAYLEFDINSKFVDISKRNVLKGSDSISVPSEIRVPLPLIDSELDNVNKSYQLSKIGIVFLKKNDSSYDMLATSKNRYCLVIQSYSNSVFSYHLRQNIYDLVSSKNYKSYISRIKLRAYTNKAFNNIWGSNDPICEIVVGVCILCFLIVIIISQLFKFIIQRFFGLEKSSLFINKVLFIIPDLVFILSTSVNIAISDSAVSKPFDWIFLFLSFFLMGRYYAMFFSVGNIKRKLCLFITLVTILLYSLFYNEPNSSIPNFGNMLCVFFGIVFSSVVTNLFISKLYKFSLNLISTIFPSNTIFNNVTFLSILLILFIKISLIIFI